VTSWFTDCYTVL